MIIKLFATLKEMLGQGEIDITLPDGATSVRELRRLVAQSHPALTQLVDRSVVAVNHEFAFNEDFVQDSDEVALFPPVSGG